MWINSLTKKRTHCVERLERGGPLQRDKASVCRTGRGRTVAGSGGTQVLHAVGPAALYQLTHTVQSHG